MRFVLIAIFLVPAVARAAPVRLARCSSGRAGTMTLTVEKVDGGWQLASRDDAESGATRTLSGKVLRARHLKVDARHHLYRFELADGVLEQAAGFDPKQCTAQGDRERCAIDRVDVALVRRGGEVGPGDDGIRPYRGDARIQMDNGGPQGCTVFASKALRALLEAP